jgi:hypothetical protein
MAHKRGDINEHGLYFFQIGSRGNEVWLPLADFEARKKRLSETNKAWVSRNRASVNERQRTKKTEAQKAAAIIYLKEWRAKNVTKCRQLKTDWRNRNRDTVRRQNNEYWKRNPDKRAEVRNRRRAHEKGCATSDRKTIKQFYKTSQRISKCLGLKFEVDHIVPLAAGGLHCPSNLQIIPWRINRIKGRKNETEINSY